MILLMLWACTDEPEPFDPGPEAESLELPDTSNTDFQEAFSAMLELAVQVHMGPAWAAHAQALGQRQAGCPDLYVGWPDTDMDEEDGLSWMDTCTTSAGLSYAGMAWWQSALNSEVDGSAGATLTATRSLVADGVVSQGDELLYEFDGDAEDSLLRIQDGDYTRWSWNSAIDATVTGAWPYGSGELAGGWRSDINLSATGGDVDSLAMSGDTFLFETRIAEVFDSFSVDFTLAGPQGAGPETCLSEPTGHISLRDSSAYWYDLVFDPEDSDGSYDNEPYTGCDGCGTLYIRGQEQPEPVCLEFTWLWTGVIATPEANDYPLSLRDPEAK